MSAEPVPPDIPCHECESAVRRAIEALHVPSVRVPTIAASVYLDAPGPTLDEPGTFEAIAGWRARSLRTGRRELLVRLVEVDGLWEETVLQEAQAPPQPLPRRVIRRRG